MNYFNLCKFSADEKRRKNTIKGTVLLMVLLLIQLIHKQLQAHQKPTKLHNHTDQGIFSLNAIAKKKWGF